MFYNHKLSQQCSCPHFVLMPDFVSGWTAWCDSCTSCASCHSAVLLHHWMTVCFILGTEQKSNGEFPFYILFCSFGLFLDDRVKCETSVVKVVAVTQRHKAQSQCYCYTASDMLKLICYDNHLHRLNVADNTINRKLCYCSAKSADNIMLLHK